VARAATEKLAGQLRDIPARRQRLQNLYRAVKTVMREVMGNKFKGLDGAEDERGIYWDPVAEVCRSMEVSQSKLSALCREYSGDNLSQTADVVRAEGVERRMRGK